MVQLDRNIPYFSIFFTCTLEDADTSSYVSATTYPLGCLTKYTLFRKIAKAYEDNLTVIMVKVSTS
jgi:hypothetical protein